MKLIYPDWPAPSNVTSVSTTRLGGCSLGAYDSFNLGMHVGDNPDSVDLNRTCLRNSFNLSNRPLWLNQIHSNKIVRVEDIDPSDSIQNTSADGTITSLIDQACVVMTADCLPVLLTDLNGEQVCAVHAGWRGMADGILEKAVSEFKTQPSNLLAWCGPCIGVDHFEVGLEVKTQLSGPEDAYRSHQDPNKTYADLKLLAAFRLEAVGVKHCYLSSHCTYADAESFYSYRRDGQTGRMATLIVKTGQ